MIRYCAARSAAIDLADGIGLLGPEPDSHCLYDPEEWDGVEHVHERDDRRRPVTWCETFAIDIRPPIDGYASYGRIRGPCGVEYATDLVEAKEWYRDTWSDHEHLGAVPPRPTSAKAGSKRVLPSAPRGAGSAVTDASASVCASNTPAAAGKY